jgi:hypothetical protein
MVSVTDPYGRILGFLDRGRLTVGRKLTSTSSVDPLCGGGFECFHRSPGSREKRIQRLGLKLGHPVWGDINTGPDPSGRGSIKFERVNYGQWTSGTRTRE